MPFIWMFPSLILLAQCGASVVYFWSGDIRHGVCWLGGALVTASITF